MTDTPTPAGDLATITNALPLTKLTLLGTFGPTGNESALFRLPRGTIRKAQTGDRVARAEIIAISDGEVILHQNGKTTRLKMPDTLADAG